MNDNLEKAYTYAKYKNDLRLPDEYVTAYDMVRKIIENMESSEKVKLVMRLRYLQGMKFSEIAKAMKITYQWVYELHKIGVEICLKTLDKNR